MESIIRDSIWSTFDVKDSKKVLNECIMASRNLAELKGMSRNLFLPELTRNYICINEAKCSAQLEGIEAEKEEVFKASVAKEGAYSEDLLKVLRVSKSLKECTRGPVNIDSLSRINSIIANTTRSLREKDLSRSGGTDADKPVPHPSGEYIIRLMEQFTEYINTDTCTDELVKAIVATAVFNAIAPFDSDNETTGIVFFHMALNHYGLTDGCQIMLCPVLLAHKEEYIRRLHFTEVSGNTEEWILFMLRMVNKAALETIGLLFTIEQVLLEINSQCRDLSFYSEQLISVVFSNLYCKSSYLVDSGIAERVTAMKYLKAMEEVGILKSEKIGREVVFLNIPLYKILLG